MFFEEVNCEEMCMISHQSLVVRNNWCKRTSLYRLASESFICSKLVAHQLCSEKMLSARGEKRENEKRQCVSTAPLKVASSSCRHGLKRSIMRVEELKHCLMAAP